MPFTRMSIPLRYIATVEGSVNDHEEGMMIQKIRVNFLAAWVTVVWIGVCFL